MSLNRGKKVCPIRESSNHKGEPAGLLHCVLGAGWDCMEGKEGRRQVHGRAS